MNTCPITYQPCEDRFSSEGLKRLARGLQDLESLPYTAAEQLHEAAARAPKMSIQGVQPKLSARLNVRKNHFEIVDKGGRFILKPQNPQFPELPENEDLSMRLAAAVGIDVPIHGMVYSKDNTFTYFIKRFDRIGRRRKLAVEDFAQLSDLSRETKYDSSMEKVVRVIETFCTFPAVDKIKLFRLTLVNFLIGNEDMHLKNFSLITRDDKIELSPAYDLISTTIALANPQEEIALPLMEKKSGLNRKTIIDYFGKERLELTDRMINAVLDKIKDSVPIWNELIHVSFLSLEMKEKYLKLLNTREALIFP
ncbi:MAG: HipA domain-containing protein [Deltaproteobacteria bacterium]|nr:HipA domain-containing protein [Deltaproteobacteria bacterium]MBW1984980.1 HipA domain-containing protein [Deltaproteobacteria bacterium]